eukprot:m.87702 g.87702  ORF g.87702 m.87702 type:complete len:63 (-) comp8791_c4_seq4:1458-1646(-)
MPASQSMRIINVMMDGPNYCKNVHERQLLKKIENNNLQNSKILLNMTRKGNIDFGSLIWGGD